MFLRQKSTMNCAKKIYCTSHMFKKCKILKLLHVLISGTCPVENTLYSGYILKMPNSDFWIGALRAALMLRPRTILVSTGSIMPSSQSLALE